MDSEIYIQEKPTDGISRVWFALNSDSLLVTSWDSNAYLYDSSSYKLVKTFLSPHPILDGDYFSQNKDDASIVIGDTVGNVITFDIETQTQ